MSGRPPDSRAEDFHSRYPGTSPFDDSPDDVSRFFGRDEEAEEVYLRILSVPLLVQFGTSGLGKTSLLQAGVFPRLRRKPFLPVMIRLNTAEDSLVESVVRSVGKSCEIEELKFTPGDTSGLWEFLSTTTVFRDDLLLTPVLVFDQFEEVFTLRDATFRASLAAELGALASGILPPRLQGAASPRRPNVKIVISLREDYVGSLEEFAASIPGLFHERLRLEPFTERAARDAVVRPALLESIPGEEPFGSPRFELEPRALDALIQYLRGRSGIIEPIQLQLLSRHAETIARGKPRAGDDPVRLTLDDFRGRQSFASVLENFYRDTLRKISSQSQRANAARLCEEGLLGSDGHRLMLEERQVLHDFDVRAETLHVLTQEKLIRREQRLESVFYEISHDRLAESIFNTRRVRLPKSVKQALWFAGAAAAIVVAVLVVVNVRVSRARDRAEELISFLIGEQFLGEVRDMGSSTLLQQVQEQVARSGESENRNALLRGLDLRNQGDIKRLQGDVAAAEKFYEQAVQAFAKETADADDLREAAQAHERLAGALNARRAFTAALARSETAVAAWRRVVARDNAEDRADDCISLADSLLTVGTLRDRLGAGDRALPDADAAVDIISNVLFGTDDPRQPCQPVPGKAEPYPDSRALQVLSRAALLRALVLDTSEDYEGAATLAREARALRPSSTSARKYSLEALSWRAYGQRENPQRALDDYRQVQREAEEMRRWDPGNRPWQRERAVTLQMVGRAIALCHKHGGCSPMPDLAEAAAVVLEAIATLRALAQLDPNDLSLDADIFWAQLELSDVLAVGTQDERRLELLEIAERSHAKLQKDPESMAMLAYLRQGQADALAALGRRPEAVEAFRESVAAWETLVAGHPKHPVYVNELSSLRKEEAALLREIGDIPAAEAAERQASLLAARYEGMTRMYDQSQDSIRNLNEAPDRLAALASARKYVRLRPASVEGYASISSISNSLWEEGKIATDAASLNETLHAAQIAAWLAPEDQTQFYSPVLLTTRDRFGTFLADHNRLQEALAMVTEQVAVAEALTRQNPDLAVYQTSLGEAKCKLGHIRRRLNQDGWEEGVRSGLIHLQKATTLDSVSPGPWIVLGRWRRYLGAEVIKDGRPKHGAVQYAFALASYEKAVTLPFGRTEETEKAIKELRELVKGGRGR